MGSTRVTPEERFWAKVDVRGPNECWPWLASRFGKGQYGHFWANGKHIYAHRYSYFLANGHYPNLTTDHTCRNHICVNPRHLEDVSMKENIARSPRARVTHCKNGHPLTMMLCGRRGCTICRKAASDAWRERNSKE